MKFSEKTQERLSIIVVILVFILMIIMLDKMGTSSSTPIDSINWRSGEEVCYTECTTDGVNFPCEEKCYIRR